MIGELSSLQAKFWEGALGNLKFKSLTRSCLSTALHPVSGVYKAIHHRLLLYDRMCRRDMLALEETIQMFHEKSSSSSSSSSPSSKSAGGSVGIHGIAGGMALVYALRLRADVLAIQKTFHDVVSLAQSYAEIDLVDKFLLSCGKVSYTGPEMFAAISIRQELIKNELNKNQSFETKKQIIDNLGMIKMRALLTNLMISRDFIAIETKLQELQINADADVNPDQYTDIIEYNEAHHMLLEYKSSQDSIKKAIQAKSIEMLDQAIAFASCRYFYSDHIDKALEVLTEISRNPATLLLAPIVNSLRRHNIGCVDQMFEAAYNLGLHHPAMNAMVCAKIHDRVNKITLVSSCLNHAQLAHNV